MEVVMEKVAVGKISIVIVLLLLMCAIHPVEAESKDVNGHWAEEAIEKWEALGLANGYGDETFKPNNAVTRAEFVTMINNLFDFQDVGNQLFTDVPKDQWYYDAVQKSAKAGVIEGYNGEFRPNDLITRQEAVVVLARAFQMKASDELRLNQYEDSVDVADWAISQMNTCIVMGYVKGRGNNRLVPNGNLTRAEAITLLDNIGGTIINEEQLVSGEISGNLFISAPGIKISNSAILGNVYIAQGVGDGEVIFENTKIEGRLILLGGGEKGIYLKNSRVENILVRKAGGKIGVFLEGNSVVEHVEMLSGGRLVEGELNDGISVGEGFKDVQIVGTEEEVLLEGDYQQVTLDSPNVKLNIKSGAIVSLIVNEGADHASVFLGETVVVDNMTIWVDMSVEGTGQVLNAKRLSTVVVQFERDPLVEEVFDSEVTIIEEEIAAGLGGNEGGNEGGNGGNDNNDRLRNLYITITAGIRKESILIQARLSQGYREIFRQVLSASVDLVTSEDYQKYLEKEANFLIDGIGFLVYANEQDVEGTIYESVGNATTTKEKIVAALEAMEANINTMSLVREDTIRVAKRIDFTEITYSNIAVSELVLMADDGTIYRYRIGIDGEDKKVDYINAYFDKLEVITMLSEVEYELEVFLEDGTSKSSRFWTSLTI